MLTLTAGAGAAAAERIATGEEGGEKGERPPAAFFFFLFPRAPSPGAIAIRGRESRKWGWVVDRGSGPGIVLDDRVWDSGIKERPGSGCRRLHGS